MGPIKGNNTMNKELTLVSNDIFQIPAALIKLKGALH